MNFKYIKKVILLIVSLFVVFELVLRFYFGFCDAVTYEEDTRYEYIPKPNQKRFRFRNHINYNSMSMRSDEIDTSAVIILGFGDSVLNGGTLTDQDSLATSILSDELSQTADKKVQFLNISAGSWGPDNCFEYLQKYGHFNTKHIFLFVSSHDAYDNITHESIVGNNVNYPNKQYKLAIIELLERYIFPKIRKTAKNKTVNNLGINKNIDNTFNQGFFLFQKYSTENKIPLTIYLHAELSERKKGKYNKQGQKIIKFAEENNIPLIKDLNKKISITDYRDNIHFNEKGQVKIADIIFNYIRTNDILNLYHKDSILNEN